ncbi:MAG: hypothetical protein E7013_04220 [Alphaproteobacteria bacterium]|nr:hypothetical protein [Alphaproteobacteria bacterium]
MNYQKFRNSQKNESPALKGKLISKTQAVLTATLIADGLLQLNEFAKHPEQVTDGIDAGIELANLSAEQKKQVAQQLALELKDKVKGFWTEVNDGAVAAVELYNLSPELKKELAVGMMSDAKEKLSEISDKIAKETKGIVKDVEGFFNLPEDKRMEIAKEFLKDAGDIYRKKTGQIFSSAGQIFSHIAKKIDGK